MTADTRPVAQEAALDRLREIVKPGGTVGIIRHGRTRSGREQITLRCGGWANITYAAAEATGTRFVQGTDYLGLRRGVTPDEFLDRLSEALFGEPGQIKGEYL